MAITHTTDTPANANLFKSIIFSPSEYIFQIGRGQKSRKQLDLAPENLFWPQLNVKEAMRGVAKNDRPVCVVDMGVYTGFEFVTFPFCR